MSLGNVHLSASNRARIDRLIDDSDDHDTPEFKLAISELARLIQKRTSQAKAEDSCAAKGGEGVAAPPTVPKGKDKKGKRGKAPKRPKG